jgi:hypothetical protein
MNKVYLDTYWFMFGVESGERSKLIQRAWLTSVLPPFYRGTGISIRFGRHSLKFGVCYPRMPVTVDEYTYTDDMEQNLDALLGYELEQEQEEIRKWRVDEQSPTSTPPTSSAS